METTEKKVAVAPMSAEVEKGSGEKTGADVLEGSVARTGETMLRVVPIGLSVAAMVVMLRNAAQSDVYGEVSYADVNGFRYLVYANGMCAAYSLFSALYTAAPRGAGVGRAWALYLLDQVLTYIVLTAAAASSEVLYLAYKGDQEVTWSEACGDIGGFCRKAKASVGITFAAMACYIILSVISSFRLFSSYDPAVTFLQKAAGVAAIDG